MTTTPDLADIGGYRMFEPVTLRYSDQDAMGHVNNVAYAALFESARLALLTDFLVELDEGKLGFVLANLTIDYRKEMHFPGEAQVGGRLLQVGGKSLMTGYGAFLNGVCHATATCVNVCFDTETRRSYPFPTKIRAALLERIGD